MKRAILRRARSQRRGYSLAESLVAVLCFSFVGAIFLTVFISMLTSAASISHLSTTSSDASNAIGVVTGALRESRRFDLMDGGAYGNTYLATDSSGNVVAVTGIHIVYPAARAAIRVTTDTSGTSVTLSGDSALLTVNSDGATLDVFRSDENGNPAPNDGTCVWMRGTYNGTAIPGAGRILMRDVAPTVGAVQFIQPYQPGTNTPLANQVEVKITASTYDYKRGNVSSEQTRGNKATALTGEQSYLRNHDPNGAFASGAHGKTQYNPN